MDTDKFFTVIFNSQKIWIFWGKNIDSKNFNDRTNLRSSYLSSMEETLVVYN